MNKHSLRLANMLIAEIAKLEALLQVSEDPTKNYSAIILKKLGLPHGVPANNAPQGSKVLFEISNQMGTEIVEAINKGINKYNEEIEKL